MADAAETKHEHEEGGEDDEKHVEEEVHGSWAPQVSLPEVAVTTGEENEEVVYKDRSKLFRWDATEKAWKERGTGDIRLLKNRETKKVRVLMRQEKTLKIVANHVVSDVGKMCVLEPNAGSDRSWMWMASDFADGVAKTEQFAARFSNSEQANKFKTNFNAVRTYNGRLARDEAVEDVIPGVVYEKKEESEAVPAAEAPAAVAQPAAEVAAPAAEPAAAPAATESASTEQASA
eukprot:GILJ01000547.1.p1 GENE.GILJ01000547.1~~GILJ01000547.1.p1  ORF type:complete len:249 (-),score=61.69 GILJ01000547.1:62-760(-)